MLSLTLTRQRRYEPGADRRSEEYKAWRQSDQWKKWNAAVTRPLPHVDTRHATDNKQAVAILFNDLGPRFADRNGGYTRILKLAKPRLGDAGDRAILEFVGVRDRAAKKSQKPAFETAE